MFSLAGWELVALHFSFPQNVDHCQPGTGGQAACTFHKPCSVCKLVSHSAGRYRSGHTFARPDIHMFDHRQEKAELVV